MICVYVWKEKHTSELSMGSKRNLQTEIRKYLKLKIRKALHNQACLMQFNWFSEGWFILLKAFIRKLEQLHVTYNPSNQLKNLQRK